MAKEVLTHLICIKKENVNYFNVLDYTQIVSQCLKVNCVFCIMYVGLCMFACLCVLLGLGRNGKAKTMSFIKIVEEGKNIKDRKSETSKFQGSENKRQDLRQM